MLLIPKTSKNEYDLLDVVLESEDEKGWSREFLIPDSSADDINPETASFSILGHMGHKHSYCRL